MDIYRPDSLKLDILGKFNRKNNKPYIYATHINTNTVIELIENDADIEKSIDKLINKSHFDTLDKEAKYKYLFYIARNYLYFKNSYLAMQKNKK